MLLPLNNFNFFKFLLLRSFSLVILYPVQRVNSMSGNCTDFLNDIIMKGVKSFQSPNFPNRYPSYLNCVRVIYAPAGQRIVLDFDHFDLEPKPWVSDRPSRSCNARADFLEVRNGPYGFSSLIGYLCGDQMPHAIRSTSNAMFIRLKTDERLEYSGFKVSYRFEDLSETSKEAMPTQPNFNCTQEILSDSDGLIGSDPLRNISSNFTDMSLECIYILKAPDPSYQIQLVFPVYQLPFPNNCSLNFVSVYDRYSAESSKVAHFCGGAARPVEIKSHVAYVRMTFKRLNKKAGVVLQFTMFKRVPTGCDSSMFQCGDRTTCISKSVVCNERINCPHNTDEENCNPVSTYHFADGRFIWMFILITIITLVIAGGAIAVNACLKDKGAKTVDKGVDDIKIDGAFSGFETKPEATVSNGHPVFYLADDVHPVLIKHPKSTVVHSNSELSNSVSAPLLRRRMEPWMESPDYATISSGSLQKKVVHYVNLPPRYNDIPAVVHSPPASHHTRPLRSTSSKVAPKPKSSSEGDSPECSSGARNSVSDSGSSRCSHEIDEEDMNELSELSTDNSSAPTVVSRHADPADKIETVDYFSIRV